MLLLKKSKKRNSDIIGRVLGLNIPHIGVVITYIDAMFVGYNLGKRDAVLRRYGASILSDDQIMEMYDAGIIK